MTWLRLETESVTALMGDNPGAIKEILTTAAKKVDANGDGVIDREELAASAERMREALRDPQAGRQLLGHFFEPFNDPAFVFLATPVADLPKEGDPFKLKLKTNPSVGGETLNFALTARAGAELKVHADWPEVAGSAPADRTPVCASLYGSLALSGRAAVKAVANLSVNAKADASGSLDYYFALPGNYLGAKALAVAVSHLQESPFDLQQLSGHLDPKVKLHAVQLKRGRGLSVEAKMEALAPVGAHSVKLAVEGSVVLGSATECTAVRESGGKVRLYVKASDTSSRGAEATITFKVSLSQAADAVLGVADRLAGSGVKRFFELLKDRGYLKPGTLVKEHIEAVVGESFEALVSNEAVRKKLVKAFEADSLEKALKDWLEEEINDAAQAWSGKPGELADDLKNTLKDQGLSMRELNDFIDKVAKKAATELEKELKKLAGELSEGANDTNLAGLFADLKALKHDLKAGAASADSMAKPLRKAIDQAFKTLDGVRKAAEAAANGYLTVSYSRSASVTEKSAIDANFLFDVSLQSARTAFPGAMTGDRDTLKRLIFGEVAGVETDGNSRITKTVKRKQGATFTVTVLGLSFVDAFTRDATVHVSAGPGGVVHVWGKQELKRSVSVAGRKQEAMSLDVLSLCAAAQASSKAPPFTVSLTLSGKNLSRREVGAFLKPFEAIGLKNVETDKKWEALDSWRGQDVRLLIEQVFERQPLQELMEAVTDRPRIYRDATSIIRNNNTFWINHGLRGKQRKIIDSLSAPDDDTFSRIEAPISRDASNSRNTGLIRAHRRITRARQAIVGVADGLDVLAEVYGAAQAEPPSALTLEDIRSREKQIHDWQEKIAKGISLWLEPHWVFGTDLRARERVFGSFELGPTHALMELLHDLCEEKPVIRLTACRMNAKGKQVEAIELTPGEG